MTVDADNDVVTFDYYEGFISSNLKNDTDYMEYYFLDNGGEPEYTGELKGVEFDLSKYDLDIVENDGSVYLPFCTLNDIFSDTDFALTYKKEQFNIVSVYGQMGAKGKFASVRSEAYAKYDYNELCFSIDCFAGRPSNALFTESIVKNGLDKTFDSYNSITPKVKELLLSRNVEDYCAGLILLQYYLYDGGHTRLEFSIGDRLKKYGISDPASAAKKVFGSDDNKDVKEIIEWQEKKAAAAETNKLLSVERSNAYNSFELVKQWNGITLYRTGDTFFFSFGYFDDSVLSAFKESMDYAAEHNAKNFIVDVTSNNGGYPIVAAYMISLMSGDVDYLEKSIVSGNIVRFNSRIDKNLDGKFDEKDDEVKYNFRCAVLGCRDTYSCPNEFACFAQDAGICIIGETTGGGSCCVVQRLYTNGACYNISGSSMYLRVSGKDADKGAMPDVPMPGAEYNYEGFYNINLIKKGIAEFYGDPIPDTEVLYGDIDNDSVITSNDALTILRASVGIVTFNSD